MSLYSIGLPPEIFGLNTLNRDDLAYLKEAYILFAEDIGEWRWRSPARFIIQTALRITKEIKAS